MTSPRILISLTALSVLTAVGAASASASAPGRAYDLREINHVPPADAQSVIAILGATLIDGRGGAPLADSAVVIRGNQIAAVGRRGEVPLPPGARIIEAAGQALLPG